ncbi:hypothetical protein ACIOWB_25225 [Pseudomonas capeferrum]|uniref:hypothetical protein n=1 Tax=Pseudomonas capeferrum TaxID=1495066 RepID=UPI00380A8227
MTSINPQHLHDRLTSVAKIESSRLPKHGRHGSRVTIFPSKKNNAPLMCESLLEAAFCLELERRADVTCYRIHPYTLTFAHRKIRYTPDFEVTFASGAQQLIEVKNDQSFDCQKTKARLLRIVELLTEHDCLLECLPMRHFYDETRTTNLNYLYNRGYNSDGLADTAICRHIAQQGNQVLLKQLIKTPFEPTDIAHALFYQVIECNIRKAITDETAVWLSYSNIAAYCST